MGSVSPGASHQLTSELRGGGVNSGSHSPNNAHQYLLNIALCPPRVKGIALNRQRLQKRSGHQCSPLLRILLFSQTFNTYCSGLPSCQVSGTFSALREKNKRVHGNAPLFKCQGDDFQESELGMNVNMWKSWAWKPFQ